ncbi:MAG: dethiobiotin synthase [Myxococcales bacterium]|nr:MAG: dethiobiotin synthase [Myxococcales bacterium]
MVSCALIAALRHAGLRAVGMKPIASGSQMTSQGLRNDDALRLQAAGRVAEYNLVNPFAYEAPIAPHIAAAQTHVPIELGPIVESFSQLAKISDTVVVEGAGGFRVPLDIHGTTMAEIPKQLGLDVVMVVAIRLGCLNHALLTAEAIQSEGLRLIGWVANCVDENVPFSNEQIATLCTALNVPLMGRLPLFDLKQSLSPETIAGYLTIDYLVSDARKAEL